MKKITIIVGILFLAGGFFLGSCNSSKSLCPAYPPSTYQTDAGDIGVQSIDTKFNFEYIESKSY